MKITALLVLKSPGDSSSSSGGGEQQAVVLANASDVSHFGYFQRPAAREFIVFVARTVALRTPAGRRQSVQHEGTSTSLPLPPFPLQTLSAANPPSIPHPAEYKVHCYNQNGLCAIAFTDDHYPVRSAFSLLNMVRHNLSTLLSSNYFSGFTYILMNCHVCTDIHPYPRWCHFAFLCNMLAKLPLLFPCFSVCDHTMYRSILISGFCWD